MPGGDFHTSATMPAPEVKTPREKFSRGVRPKSWLSLVETYSAGILL